MISELDEVGLVYDTLPEVQKEFFRTFIWNGVGSRDYALDPPEAIFHKCSLYHDFYYWRGGPDKYRIMADRDFFHRCKSQVRKQKYMWWFYGPTAYLYFVGLKALGKVAFELRDTPCETWEELLERVYRYYDNNPKKKNRPPVYSVWLKEKYGI